MKSIYGDRVGVRFQGVFVEVEYRIGVQVGEYFGIGTEGSSAPQRKPRSRSKTAELSLISGPSDGTPFDSFRIDGYWLEPNPDGYWVPLNRRGVGDAPGSSPSGSAILSRWNRSR